MEGSLPRRFLVDGEEQSVSLECNWTAHREYRKRRLAQTLVDRLRTDNALIFAWHNATSHRVASRWRKAIARRTETSGSVQNDMPLMPLINPIDWGALANLLTDSRSLGAAESVTGAPVLAGWDGPWRGQCLRGVSAWFGSIPLTKVSINSSGGPIATIL